MAGRRLGLWDIAEGLAPIPAAFRLVCSNRRFTAFGTALRAWVWILGLFGFGFPMMPFPFCRIGFAAAGGFAAAAGGFAAAAGLRMPGGAAPTAAIPSNTTVRTSLMIDIIGGGGEGRWWWKRAAGGMCVGVLEVCGGGVRCEVRCG